MLGFALERAGYLTRAALFRVYLWLGLGLSAALLVCGLRAGEPSLRHDPTYLIDTWDSADGLPENSATSMAQTPDGYLWFGTFNGLVRFDGVKFKVFNPANTPALPIEGIVKVHCDRGGRLWVSTYQGLAVLEDGQWRQVTKDNGRAGDYARTMAERPNGDLLITSFNGKVFEYSGGRLAELPPPPGERGSGYLGGIDEEGHWWVAQNGFIGLRDGAQWLKKISTPDLPADMVGCAPARDGGLWVLLGEDLRKVRRGVEVARRRLPERPGGVWSLSEDSRGNVWIATRDRGVCRVAPDGAMERRTATNGWSDHVNFVFEDREKNLWVGTSGAGLMRLRPRRFHSFGLESGLKESLVRSVWPGKDGMWVGTYGQGVFRVDDRGITSAPLLKRGFVDPYAQSVLEDRAGRVWIGTAANSLWLIESSGVRQIPREQCGGPSVLALFEDSRGRIWVSGGESIAVFDGHGFRGFGAGQGLPFGGVIDFAEDQNGTIWLSNGEAVFRQEQDRCVEVRTGDGQSISGVNCLKADPDGSLWFGSRDRSLLRWRNGRLAVLPLETEFPVKSIRSILQDDQGIFWMTSERSVVRARRGDLHALMDGQTTRFPYQIFDASDGLPRAEFSGRGQPQCARDGQGWLWFATSKGLARIDPAALQLNDVPPPVHIGEISFHQPSPKAGKQPATSGGAQEVETQWAAPFSGPVSLPAGSRRIAIQYSGLSYAAPGKSQFQVKLEGEDSDWVNAGSQRVAYYHELPPKDYLFRVRAANNDNVWNEAGASLAFSVRPFYWQTLWFQLLMSMGMTGLGLGIVWVTIRGKIRDIRARERAQEALKQSEERYREVVESQIEFVCRFRPDMTLTFVNEAYCRFFGQRRDDLIGRSFLDVLPASAREPTLHEVRSLVAHPQTAASDHEVMLTGRHSGWQHWTYHAIAGSKGEVAEFQAIGRDITDRKHAEDQLRESEARFRTVADAAPALIWMSGVDKLCTFFNRPWLDFTGRTLAQELGDGWTECIHPDDFEKCLKEYGESFDARRPFTLEYRLRRHDGEYRWMSDHGVPRYDSDRRFLGYIGSCVDLTDRKQAEAEAQRGRVELAHVARVSTMGALAGSIAHELNQPLTAILSNAQAGTRFLANPAPNVTEVRAVLQDIAQDTKRAGEVIRQMRKLVKKDDPQFESIDPGHMIHEVVRLLHSDTVIRKVQIALDCRADLASVRGDSVQLQQVLLNLLLNAFDAMKDVAELDRIVRVRAWQPEEARAIQIEVSDRGAGIQPEKLPRIFEPFQTTKREGLGLGLSISRSIVEAHGGQLWVEKNSNRGATFCFTIPLEAAPVGPDQP
jgi:PAS domain S-box-containing protein